LAVVATLSKGYDLDYIWAQVDRGPAKDAAGYYIQASESGGEPPGRWWGPGAEALGFKPGQTVERRPYVHSEMLKTRVAHGYCSCHQAAAACPYANICETCDESRIKERLNREIRRRTDVVGIFPGRDSLIRLVGAVLAEQHDEWTEGRRYLGLDVLSRSRITPAPAAIPPTEVNPASDLQALSA